MEKKQINQTINSIKKNSFRIQKKNLDSKRREYQLKKELNRLLITRILPGSNNQYTVGRKIDTYERNMETKSDGWTNKNEEYERDGFVVSDNEDD